MDNLKILNRVKEIYSQNHNIIKFLKDTNGNINNTIEDILISYDFQAGSYIDHYKKNPEFKAQYCSGIANVINQLGCFNSVLEVGIGEATTLGNLIKYLKHTPNRKYGFDISWSRIKYAKKFLQSLNISDIGLFTGDMFNTPIKDNAIDIVYTSHSIEPNGGREKEALTELYRITKKYLILLEPTYEFGGKEAKKRMLEHGYVTNLYGSAKELGYKVIEHRLFDIIQHSTNPTGLIIIEKDLVEDDLNKDTSDIYELLCCPITKTDLFKMNDAYYSKESLLAYPIINGTPCLLPNNAIIATHFLD